MILSCDFSFLDLKAEPQSFTLHTTQNLITNQIAGVNVCKTMEWLKLSDVELYGNPWEALLSSYTMVNTSLPRSYQSQPQFTRLDRRLPVPVSVSYATTNGTHLHTGWQAAVCVILCTGGHLATFTVILTSQNTEYKAPSCTCINHGINP